MEEFLVTDFLINGTHASEDIQMFDTRDFGLPQDYAGVDVNQSSSTSGSPFEEDLHMVDAAPVEWMPLPMAAAQVRPQSPNRVLAVQAQVNQIVKVEPIAESALQLPPMQMQMQMQSTPPPPEKATKKRRREPDNDVADAIPEGLAAVYLRREQLLTISSAEHEVFVQRISNVRDLTEAELKEVKRQRRLIKNREYAQTSRQKKKVTMGHVKDQVCSLENENEELKAEIEKLRARVMELELENATLRVQISKEQTSSEDTSFDSGVVVDMAPKTKVKANPPKSTFGFRPAMAATSVFFVFLFAFGLFFNSPLFNAVFSSSLPGAKTINPYHTGRTVFGFESHSHASPEAATVEAALSFPSAPEAALNFPSASEPLANSSHELVDACLNAVSSSC